MISPRKVENDEINSKLYPTINFVCPVSLKSWGLMRNIALDIGKKYTNCLLFLISGSLVFMLSTVIGVILSYFKIIEIKIY